MSRAPLNPNLKKALLDIPEHGASASTMAKLWNLSVHEASTLLNEWLGIHVKRSWRGSWKRRTRLYFRIPSER
jgi:hypothetical protein